MAFAAGAKATGQVHRAVEGPARVLRQFTLHSRQPLEERTLWLLLHRREAGVPGPAQRLLARQPAAAGAEPGLGPAGRPGLGPLPLVSRSGETEARAARSAKAAIALRPFDIVLLEAVEHGESPSLGRQFRPAPIPLGFPEATCPLPCRTRRHVPTADAWEASERWTVLGPVEARSAGGATLAIQAIARSWPAAGTRGRTPIDHGPNGRGGHHGDSAGSHDRSEPSPDGAGPGERRELHSQRFLRPAWPRGSPAAARTVAFHDPLADHSESYPGNRPIARRSAATLEPAGRSIRRKGCLTPQSFRRGNPLAIRAARR